MWRKTWCWPSRYHTQIFLEIQYSMTWRSRETNSLLLRTTDRCSVKYPFFCFIQTFVLCRWTSTSRSLCFGFLCPKVTIKIMINAVLLSRLFSSIIQFEGGGVQLRQFSKVLYRLYHYSMAVGSWLTRPSFTISFILIQQIKNKSGQSTYFTSRLSPFKKNRKSNCITFTAFSKMYLLLHLWFTGICGFVCWLHIEQECGETVQSLQKRFPNGHQWITTEIFV